MKSYIAADGFDCSPDGPMVLGSILTDPLDPSETLNAHPLPVPDSEKTTITQNNFETVLKRNSKRSGGLWFKFLQSLGFEVSASSDEASAATAKFDKLETWSFQPSDAYMRESIAAAEVQSYLAGHTMRKPLYMVTGVKVAHGARVIEMVRKGKAGKMRAGFDGSAAGLPSVAFGPQAEGSKGFESVQRFVSDGPVVFAYRLREIRYRKGILTGKLYRDGALYSVGEGAADAEGEKPEEEGIIFLELDEDDVTGDDVGVEPLEVWEDGAEGEEDEDCELIVPTRGQDV
jgi:hypothetical protein